MSDQNMQPVRGTKDYLFDECEWMSWMYRSGLDLIRLYGYHEVSTPIFEFSSVFHRTLGESSDMVSKETYTFKDRGGDDITLRPEGTAGIARAFVSNGLAQQLPLKLYYFGPMFRYERPQKGRQRQFHQFGVECLGLNAPWSDVDSINMAYQLLSSWGLSDRVQLEINALGDSESRSKHKSLLVEYLRDFQSQLSPESQIRLDKNPLRILDSKDPQDQSIVRRAPSIASCLNAHSIDFFSQVQEGLTKLMVPFHVNPHLVRGIDYYTHTVFEITTQQLGAQGTVLAGGRYDGLIEQMGGPSTPGFGWASGVERLMMLLEQVYGEAADTGGKRPPWKKSITSCAVICSDPDYEMHALWVTESLRQKTKKKSAHQNFQQSSQQCPQDAHQGSQNPHQSSQDAHQGSQNPHQSSQDAHQGSQNPHQSSQDAHQSAQNAQNTIIEFLGSGSFGKKLKKANKIGVQFVFLIGESEYQSQSLTLKNLLNGEQKTITLEEALAFVENL